MGQIVDIDGEKMHVKQGRYPSTAQNYLLLENILKTTDEGASYYFPYAVLSVALPGEEIEFDEIIMKSNSDYRDLVEKLELAEVISSPIRAININFTTVTVHKLIEK